MPYTNMILALTTDLLANGSFNHLKDDELSNLHYVLLKLHEGASPEHQQLLLTLWNNADGSQVPQALLYKCNMLLLGFGRTPIEG